MYSSVVTGGYLGLPPGTTHVGKQEISAPWLGLQKNAIDWRAGVMPSVSLIAFAGGATTRWRVERSTSLLQRAKRSPALMTMVPGYEPVRPENVCTELRLTMGVAGWKRPVCGF